MLVLLRNEGEAICLSNGVRITLVRIEGSRARLGIEAPAEIAIVREELLQQQVARQRFELAQLRQRDHA